MKGYYVDAEAALQSWLGMQVTARVVTELPAKLQDVITASGGVVQVGRISGASQEMMLDRATVQVDCYAADRPAARALAYQVYGLLVYELAGNDVAGGFVSGVKEVMAPISLPHAGDYARRFSLTVQIVTHTT